MDIIVGTAGHIDHGKTALVKALTGVDADRLPEEKQRGITIDLGFAELQSGDLRIGFIDVPGHERFVKNMLAGASGIDLVLLVVAADEGVMPQTREHFDICRLLHVRCGAIALTKSDLADDETVELARLDVAELVKGSFLENAPVFAVSSRSRAGINDLKSGLVKLASRFVRESDVRDARLSIDRSFSVKGFGAVVTGTLASGKIAETDELELLPGRRSVRVRGVQVYGRPTSSAHAGQRTAVNLAGVGHGDIERGMVIATPGALTATQVVDAEVEVLADARAPLRSRQRVRVHLGTSEVLARIAVLNDAQELEVGSVGYVQLRLESPVVAAHGDRFIVRQYSPQITVAGGRVLDPSATRHRRTKLAEVRSVLDRLSAPSANVCEIFVEVAGERGTLPDELRLRTGLTPSALGSALGDATASGKIIDAGGIFLSHAVCEQLKRDALAAIERHHRDDRLSRGMPRELLRERVFRHSQPEVFRFVLDSLTQDAKIVSEHDIVKLIAHRAQLSSAERSTLEQLRDIYLEAGLEVPKLDEVLMQSAAGLDQKETRRVFQLLVEGGELVQVSQEFYFPVKVLAELTAKLRASGSSTIDVPKFKEIAGVSRKYAIPLLEYFDRIHITRRVGDKRQVLP